MPTLADHPMFKDYFADADYWDLKHITADVSLRDFIAGMLGFEPWWIAMLYRIRELLVIGLGLVRHEKPEDLESLTPDRIPFTSGEKASFFIVHRAEEDRFWVAETPPDNHLSAYFGIVAHPLGDGRNQFSVFTTVRYRNWTGPVYFNLIRPFHHLVVREMMKAGARRQTEQTRGCPATPCKTGLIDQFKQPFQRIGENSRAARMARRNTRGRR
ncbi:conserved hypothetical protein [Desulfosarcina cetonica]|nr:conserved hypothetical protein [Desulfosarcina cetonica]